MMGVRKTIKTTKYVSTWFINRNKTISWHGLFQTPCTSGQEVWIYNANMFRNWDASEEFTWNRCYLFQKAYFKYKSKCLYGRSGKTNIRRTESKRTTKAKYKEWEIDAFSPTTDVVKRSIPCKKRNSRTSRICLDNYSNLAI